MVEDAEEWMIWTDPEGHENRGLVRMRARICPQPHDAEVVCSECLYYVALAESPESPAVYLIELTFPEGGDDESPGLMQLVEPAHPHYGMLIGIFGEYLARKQADSEEGEVGEEEVGEEADSEAQEALWGPQEVVVESAHHRPPARFNERLERAIPHLPAQLVVYLQTMLAAAPRGWVVGPFGGTQPATDALSTVLVSDAGICVEIDVGMLDYFGADPESQMAMWQSILAVDPSDARDLGITSRYQLVVTDIPHSYGSSYGFTRMFSVTQVDIGEA